MIVMIVKEVQIMDVDSNVCLCLRKSRDNSAEGGLYSGDCSFLHIKDCLSCHIPNPRPPTVFMLLLLR